MLQALLRIIIIFVAGFTIWQFSDGFLLAWETLAEPMEAQWFNVLSALCEGVLGPVLALSAIALSATNERLVLAAVLASLAAVIYVTPIAAFWILTPTPHLSGKTLHQGRRETKQDPNTDWRQTLLLKSHVQR